MRIGADVRVTSKKNFSEFTGKYMGSIPLGYLGRKYGKLIETPDKAITLVREDFFIVEEITPDIKKQNLKEAFKHVSDFAAGETHKRKYPTEELKKLSESLILLHEFFEKYEEVKE